MRRRVFIKIAMVTVAGATVGFFVFDFKRVVRMILAEDTEHLNLANSNSVEQFLQEAEREYFWSQFSATKRVFICGQHLLYRLGIPFPYQYKYFQYRSVITGQFLLSTDLFLKGSSLKEPISYITFFNPYKRACASPFSNLH